MKNVGSLSRAIFMGSICRWACQELASAWFRRKRTSAYKHCCLHDHLVYLTWHGLLAHAAASFLLCGAKHGKKLFPRFGTGGKSPPEIFGKGFLLARGSVARVFKALRYAEKKRGKKERGAQIMGGFPFGFPFKPSPKQAALEKPSRGLVLRFRPLAAGFGGLQCTSDPDLLRIWMEVSLGSLGIDESLSRMVGKLSF